MTELPNMLRFTDGRVQIGVLTGGGMPLDLTEAHARDIAERILIQLSGGNRARAAAALAMQPMTEPAKA